MVSLRRLLFGLGFPILLGGLAWADEPPADPPSPAEPPAASVEVEGVLAEIVGDDVNLRVGPRLAGRPVRQLSSGDVVLIVEELPGWAGIRVPQGFPAAVSLDYVVPEGPSGLRVMARELNLRVEPPQVDRPVPGAFRDHPALGEVLTLLDVEDPEPGPAEDGGEVAEGEAGPARPFGNRWAWIVAPESIRAYVSREYVRAIDRTPENLARLEAARQKRREDALLLANARQLVAARAASLALMEVVGSVQQDLYRLREEGGTDKAPVVELANRIATALAQGQAATPAVMRLAQALREDLEREIELRVARHDAEVARTLGRTPPAVPSLEERAAEVSRKGLLRYEPTPGWTEEGVWFLWIDGKPAFVLRPAADDRASPPRLADHADGRERIVEGSLPGERLFGLPVLSVRSVRLP